MTLEGLGGPVMATVVGIGSSVVIALFTPYALLGRRVAWHQLMPTAILTAAAITALSIASVVYVPNAISESAGGLGTIGIAIARVSWLVVIGFALTLSAAIGAVLGERLGDVRWPRAGDRGSTRSAPRP